MKKTAVITAFLALAALGPARAEEYLPESMTTHPEWFIKISDWSMYSTWGAVAIIHNVTIENTSGLTYRNVRVRVRYSSNLSTGVGGPVSQETGVLPVTLPPGSKATYLKAGVTLGAGSQFMNPVGIEVLGAEVVR
ncbi:MAG: hypothetical protein IT344_04450 [Candidatus Dadabacteria bacterium]|nr:hypothetical protein [Candidatus Dadabacteria bacterium]